MSKLRETTLESFEGQEPQIGKDVFIHETAAIIGQVTLNDRVNIWPQVTLRADEGIISVGADTNIQDGTTIHMTGGYSKTIIGARVTIGHMCLLHGCKVEDDCLIGMGTMLLDNCAIGEGSYVAAGTMITGNKVIPPKSFVMGRPGSLVVKPISEIRQKEREYSWQHYVDLASKYLSQRALPAALMVMLIPLGLFNTACSTLIPSSAIETKNVTSDSRIVIKQRHVTIATLKRLQLYDYTPFARTDFDPFSHQREVIELTGNAPIMINYLSFSAPRVDYVIERAQSLYAQYRFAQNSAIRFKSLLIARFGKSILKKELEDLESTLNAEGVEESLSPNIIAGARATRLSIAGHQDLVKRALETQSQLNGWRDLLAQDMENQVNLGVYTSKMKDEIQRAHEALDSVMSGAPLLSKSMREVSAAAAMIR